MYIHTYMPIYCTYIYSLASVNSPHAALMCLKDDVTVSFLTEEKWKKAVYVTSWLHHWLLTYV